MTVARCAQLGGQCSAATPERKRGGEKREEKRADLTGGRERGVDRNHVRLHTNAPESLILVISSIRPANRVGSHVAVLFYGDSVFPWTSCAFYSAVIE